MLEAKSLKLHSETHSCRYCGNLAPLSEIFCCTACGFLDELSQGLSLKPVQKSLKWQHLNQVQFLAQIQKQDLEAQTLRYRIYIKGLTCASCTHLLEKLPLIDARIVSARLSFLREELEIETTKDIEPAEVAAQIEHIGYEPHFLKDREETSSIQSQEMRILLSQIGVAGFCFGNIMLLAIAKYAGIEGDLKNFFSLVEITLFSPILFYSARPFYRGAVQTLKQRRIHLDLVITVSLLLSVGFSVVGHFAWGNEMYLDSLGAFIFLTLIGRWLVRKYESQTKAKSADGLFSSLQPMLLAVAGQMRTVPLKDVQKGDVIIQGRGAILPVDGELLTFQAVFDTGLVTGESVPRTFQKGMALTAGMKNVGDALRIRVTRPFDDTELFQALKDSENLYLQKSRYLERLDQIGKTILTAALALSVLAFPTYHFIFDLSFSEAWERVLSLLVVTCPCALAFGGPLSYAFALREARNRGILISKADVFDRLREARELVFDKTGTLTTGQLRLIKTEPSALPVWQKALILALESRSQHPVAFALRSAFGGEVKSIPALEDLTEVIGEKVFGIQDGEIYSVRKSPSHSEEYVVVEFSRGSEVLARLFLDDELREEAPALLNKLKSNFAISICSGDRRTRVLALGEKLGLEPDLLCAEFTPKDKLDFIKSRPKAIMFGDGFNDAAALGAALVGIAVEGPLSQSVKNADVIFLKPGLKSFDDLIEVSSRLQTTLSTNLRFTLTYNLIAGTLCLFGIINPLVAAVLMPMSSFFVLTQSKRGFS